MAEKLSYTHSQGTPFAKRALDDISIAIPAGQFLCIIGTTGSGKTTLVQHFNGLLAPQQGKLQILGVDCGNKKQRLQLWRQVGLVFQYPEHQLFEDTVYNEIAYGLKNLALPHQQIDQRVHRSLDYVGLPPAILEESPLSLSGGLKRRVAIASVLAMQPKILILDEPTAGLEPAAKRTFFNNIKQLQRATQGTIIMITHSMEDAATVADRLVVLDRGKIVMEGTPETVYSRIDELTAIGLTAPVEVQVLKHLKAKGIPVRTNILTPEKAVQEIVKNKAAFKICGR
ncbi:energy-coupling factor transporter ATPase [Peptococcaceae bacterium 1198_IL3148]